MSIFSHVSLPRIKNSLYRYNFEHKLSYRMADLIPLKVFPVLPGDKILSLGVESFTRMAPMIFPVMHRMNIKLYAFFVPNRLVWDEWEDYITGGPEGSLSPVKPFIGIKYLVNEDNADLIKTGSLMDYMGYPVQMIDQTQTGKQVLSQSVFQFHDMKYRGYQLIWNEYFRDQNLQDEIDIPLYGGDEFLMSSDAAKNMLTLRKKCWQKDYFTSALPWLQRGPLTTMPVNFDLSDGSVTLTDKGSLTSLKFRSDSDAPHDYPNVYLGAQQGNREGPLTTATTGRGILTPLNLSDFLDAQLSAQNPDAGSFLIEDLRRAVKLQEWRERNARGGARYTEQILAHFGVRSSDARLQRPEFLGATSQPISISEVLQSSESTEQGTPLGEMGGHGISARGALLCKNKFFEEHGYVFVLMSCIPRTGYFQGIDRDSLKFDKFEEYWQEFAHIGEQPIYQDELYCDGVQMSGQDKKIFGYTPRYAEYQYFPDTVAGEFRTTLKSWHMARELSKPALNGDFVTAQPTDRIFPVQYRDVEQMYAQFLFHLNMRRPVLKGATPRF